MHGIAWNTHLDLADILGRTDFDLQMLSVFLWGEGEGWESRYLYFRVPRFPNVQIRRFADADAGTGIARTLR